MENTMKSITTKETVHYETGQSFVLHHNIGTNSYPDHWHDAVEIIMPVQNAYRVDVGRQAFHLREYDILFIPSGNPHTMNAPQAKGRRIILQCDPAAAFAAHGSRNGPLLLAGPRMFSVNDDPDVHEIMKTLLLEMWEEHMQQNAYHEITIQSKIADIMSHLAGKQEKDTDLHYAHPVRRLEQLDRLNECYSFIHQHCSEHLSLQNAAHAAGFSKCYFSRWFRESTGMSFHDFLTKVRIEKAATLLLDSSLSITEVALEAGFQSTSTFNRVFKQRTSYTPREYRHMRQGQC